MCFAKGATNREAESPSGKLLKSNGRRCRPMDVGGVRLLGEVKHSDRFAPKAWAASFMRAITRFMAAREMDMSNKGVARVYAAYPMFHHRATGENDLWMRSRTPLPS